MRVLKVALVLGIVLVLFASSFAMGCDWSKRVSGDIYAGQTMDVGNYQVTVYSNRIEIKFWIDSGWCLEDNHIVVTKDMTDYMNKKGNPKIGKFPFEAYWTGSCYMLTLWKADYPELWGSGDTYIAIHVVVSQCCGGDSETGWGEGEYYWGSSWGWYFDP